MSTLPAAAGKRGSLTKEWYVAQPIATHYDNLKVRRDAPVGVIKASYRKLSLKYHPDRNPDPSALEVMKLINLAWDVLGDPERRAGHDRAIATPERTSPPGPAPAPRNTAHKWLDSKLARIGGVLGLLLLVILAAALARNAADETDADEPLPIVQPAPDDTPPAEPLADRAPHGYLNASVQDNSPGVALVEIDNTAGVQDAEVRLFRNGRAARSMNVHKGKRFLVENLAPGQYVVKYKVLLDGKVVAYQQREVFRPQRGKFSKMKVGLVDRTTQKQTADEIDADQF